MTENIPKDQIKGYECKHATFCKSSQGSGDDIVVIKEYIHTTDGKTIPNLRMVKNFVKPFWITKEGFRKHTQKKEWESQDKLQMFTTTQSNLIKSAAKALGYPGFRGSLKMLSRSPYLYGADITPPTLIKRKYQTKYPDCISVNKVAVIDIETDVVHGHERPIYVGITCRDKAFIASTEEFMGSIVKPEEKLKKKFHELLGDIVKERKIELEVMICKNAGEACAEAIKRAHQWEPDFLTAWNMDFDIPRISRVLEDYGYNLADVYSDPRVPPEFRFFKYIQGSSQKVTASGLITPIHPADRWHTAACPASFYIIDSMCLYKKIRVAKQNEPSYSLDFQLNKHLGVRKLRFKEAEQYSGLAWHEKMQKDHKIEYGIYNLFDCIGVELFDEKVRDLAQTITVQAGVSEYSIFDKQPKRLVDQLYFFCLEKGKVVATCSDEMVHDLDQYILSMKNWIVTLPSHLTVDNGLKIIEELPDTRSQARAYVADLDVSSAYPTTQLILNMSKETTFRELSKMKGIDEWTQRMAGINLTAGRVNATEIACSIFKAPTLETLLDEFEKEIK